LHSLSTLWRSEFMLLCALHQCEYNAFYEYLMARPWRKFFFRHLPKNYLFTFERIHFLTPPRLLLSARFNPRRTDESKNPNQFYKFHPHSVCCWSSLFSRSFKWHCGGCICGNENREISKEKLKNFHRLPLVEREMCWENVHFLYSRSKEHVL
jgi:hypothetical protein